MPDEREFRAGRFLGEKQREYLTGDYQPDSSNLESQYRSQIRDRTVGALVDLKIVAENLERRDRELLHEYKKPQLQRVGSQKLEELPFPGVWGQVGLSEYFVSTTEFLYKTLRENGASSEAMVGLLGYAARWAEHEVRNGYEYREGWLEEGRKAVDVETDFQLHTVQEVDVDMAKGKLERGTELSGLELKALEQAGEIEITPAD